MAVEHFRPSSKKGRGRAKASLDLIDAMYSAAEAAQPITGRGVGYKLFAGGQIPSMARSEMAKVYRLLKEAREEGTIPWEWIVDETRELERVSSWNDPAEFMDVASRSYRRDFWQDQSHRVEVWSEKGTVRGVRAPVLNKYGVGFRVLHGFSSATAVNDVAQDDDRPLNVLYVGDYDPSGLYMSEHDLPDRLERYGGDHVDIERIALVRADLADLSTFAASDKKKDPRFKWFVSKFGATCAEPTRWIRTTYGTGSRPPSSPKSTRKPGRVTSRATRPNRTRCDRISKLGRAPAPDPAKSPETVGAVRSS
jgi:hypothetical protein